MEPGPGRAGARVYGGALRCTLSGLAAWAITVLPVLSASRSGPAARVAALVALASVLLGGYLLLPTSGGLRRAHRLARHTGISAFLLSSSLSWWLASSAEILAVVDRFRAVLGMLAWAIWAVSWWHPWSLPDAELGDAPAGRAFGLTPRRGAPRAALAIAATGAAVAVTCLLVAWRVETATRAVFAQALAVVAALGVMSGAAAIAILAGRSDEGGERLRLPIDGRVVQGLLLYAVLAAGALYLTLSR